jgi:hypothetical protein
MVIPETNPIIRSAVCYTLPEVATMLSLSTALVRRLIYRRLLFQPKEIGVVRVTHVSLERLMAPAAQARFDLAAEVRAHGPCLVVNPAQIALLFGIHQQCAYRWLARGAWRTVPRITSRRVLRSVIAAALGLERLDEALAWNPIGPPLPPLDPVADERQPLWSANTETRTETARTMKNATAYWLRASRASAGPSGRS